MSPDHRFCYKHTQYAKAMAYMAYAFMRGEGFVLITGNPGTGKTTLVGNLLESLADENVTVGNLVSTQLAADDLLRMVAFSFDVEVEGAEKSLVLQRLTTKFIKLFDNGGRALLIVDEAQDLSVAALEELRLLTNLQKDGKPLLQIFLLGQSELRDLVNGAGLEQVHQRIVAASHLQALKEAETRAYVEHRLTAVGWVNDPEISTAVYPVIFKFSEGIPRRINLFCSRLFLHACVERRHRIYLEDAKAVVIELQEEQLSTRNLLNDEMFFALDSFEGPLGSSDELAQSSVQAEETISEVAPELQGTSEVAPEVEVPGVVEVALEVQVPDDVEVAPSKPKTKTRKRRAKRGAKSVSKLAQGKSAPEAEHEVEVDLASTVDTASRPDVAVVYELDPLDDTESAALGESSALTGDGVMHLSTSDRVNNLVGENTPEFDAESSCEPAAETDPASPLSPVSVISNSRFNLDYAVVWLALLTAVILIVYLME